MPKSVASYVSFADRGYDEEEEYNDSRTTSPRISRRHTSDRPSDLDLRNRMRPGTVDESTGLLSAADGHTSYTDGFTTSAPATPRLRMRRSRSYHANWLNHSRHGSLGARMSRIFQRAGQDDYFQQEDLSKSTLVDDRAWYDQFTSTDWVHDSIADAFRVKELRSRRDFVGRLLALYDAAQGWLLVAIIGIFTAAIAYCIDVTEAVVFDVKTGYCSTGWYLSKRRCCNGVSICEDWNRWSNLFRPDGQRDEGTDFLVYTCWCIALAAISCIVTLQTKTTISSALSLATLDENLAADHHKDTGTKDDEGNAQGNDPRRAFETTVRQPMTYYPAAGSGVAEVKVILSGFVLHGYLGVKTLIAKSVGLILSVGSGLSVGKEGPYVHVATCIGNISCRLFPKYHQNDGKRREALSAAAASGVAVAFGAPISGVLFSLEEVSYYFPPKTLFRTFFCCIAAALSLKFLNPYGTAKIVLFEVRYLTDWRFFEIIVFAFLGVLGGAMGALFIKMTRIWARTFRRIPAIKKYPMFEVLLVAVITAMTSFWNRYTRLPVAELLYELAAPCDTFTKDGTSLCPTQDRIPEVIRYLSIAFVIKAFLTTITFGIKVPAGIYVPSMVVGGLAGRIVGHAVQLLTLSFPDSPLWGGASPTLNPESFVTPGVYALTAAGATMCGVTRLSVTLAVILFELTGSLEHVLPFSIGVLVSKWTADALEPLSIYDLLTDMNAYPYLDSKARPVFTNDLGDITAPPRRSRMIDISHSPLVPASDLRKKLQNLHMSGELDGGLPILREGILVGLIPAPDLEFALDNLGNEENALCLMNPQARWLTPSAPRTAPTTPAHGPGTRRSNTQLPLLLRQSNDSLRPVFRDTMTTAMPNDAEDDAEDPAPARLVPTRSPQRFQQQSDPTDFTPYIDPSPVALDICSPLDLVFECFVKLGLRYICVVREGRYAGLVHKKAFVKYVKEVEEAERKGHHEN
ncbi:Voltage gated chloride channel-like protein 3 [Elsinoe fawcettii]|nr:Voltage gated chloride channel-like protein 3 [Elsinoe fawcettii]